jgi:hypothetical protein
MISGGAGDWRSRGGREATPKPVSPDAAGLVDQGIRGLDVLVDEALRVDLAKRRRQADRYAEKVRRIEAPHVPLDEPIQGLATWIFKNQDHPPLMTRERERASRPRRVEFACQRVFVFKPSETLRRRLLRRHRYAQNGNMAATFLAAVKREAPALAEWLQRVCWIICR